MMNDYMLKLANELELPLEIAKDKGGKYVIPVGEDTVVNLFDIPPGFSLYAEICKIPEQELEYYFEHALHGNLLGQGTGGGVLGLTEDGKNLTLSLDIDYSIPYNEFKEVLEEFLNTVDFWREETQMIKAGKKKR